MGKQIDAVLPLLKKGAREIRFPAYTGEALAGEIETLQAMVSNRTRTGFEELEAASLKALLDVASIHAQECKSLLKNPMFRLGAQRTIAELLPATEWAQLRIKELRKAGAP